MRKLQAIEDRYDEDQRALNRKMEEAQDDYDYFLHESTHLKEQVYDILEGDIPEESMRHLNQMEITEDYQRADFHRTMDELEEQKAQLRRAYDDDVEAVYEEARQQAIKEEMAKEKEKKSHW